MSKEFILILFSFALFFFIESNISKRPAAFVVKPKEPYVLIKEINSKTNHADSTSYIGNKETKSAPRKEVFGKIIIPDHSEALIGDEDYEENLFDNIFNFYLDDLSSTEAIRIEYHLTGLHDHLSTKRKINVGPVIGGKFVDIDKKSSIQHEILPVSAFKEGLNTMTFYPIQNIKYRIDHFNVQKISNSSNNLEWLHTGAAVYDSTSYYLKASFNDKLSDQTKVFIDGTEVSIHNLEFEYFSHQPKDRIKDKMDIKILADGKEISRTNIKLVYTLSNLFSLDSLLYTKPILLSPHTATSISILHWENKMNYIEVVGLLKSEILIPASELINVTKQYAAFRINDLTNSTDTIIISYDADKIPYGYSESDIHPFYFDELAKKWIQAERLEIDKDNDEVKVKRNKTGDYINGIIKVPESPDTKGYAPTTIKDFKPADASSGITMIDVPKANQKGTANLSFPLKLPSGRRGLQPELAISYNNEGGNGWMGLGWDLQLPSVTIETRWGVPRYDPSLESDTYLLNGEMLTDGTLPHRVEPEKRSTSDKVFHPRIEGKFDSIIRHGNNPKNYWWEVMNKNGTRHFYGGEPEKGINSETILTDSDGNIGYWALVKTIDANDNNIIYEYEKSNENGINFYPKAIHYTGFKNDKGKYRIEFKISKGREDITTNARLGFKQETAFLCDQIEVYLETQKIRTYHLKYKTGAFFKKLLQGIRELDENGDEFYKLGFEYFDEVRDENGNYKSTNLSNYEKWTNSDLPSAFSKIPLLNKINYLKPSPIGSNFSNSYGFNISLTVGPNIGKLKDNTIGGNFSYSKNSNEGLSTILDMDGDGLPDILSKEGGSLYYRKNTSKSSSYFGEKELLNTTLKDFHSSSSRTRAFGAEANAKINGFGGVFIGYSRPKTRNRTTTFLNDFNGDGLIDFANKNMVYFNRLNQNNLPELNKSSIETENPIGKSKQIMLSQRYLDSLQSILIMESPMHEMVRVWEAPFSGEVKIDAKIKLYQDTSTESKEYLNKDGVVAKIDYNGKIDSININFGNFSTLPFNRTVNVEKGKKIYFRLQTKLDGAFDKVIWSPIIEYVAIEELKRNPKLSDEPSKNISKYSASDDYVLSGNQLTTLPYDGRIVLNSLISKNIITDDLEFRILKLTEYYKNEDTLDRIDTVFIIKDSINRKEIFSNKNITDTIVVKKDDQIFFQLFSHSNVDWSSIKIKSDVHYIEAFDASGSSIQVFDSLTPVLQFHPVIDYIMYNHIIYPTTKYFYEDSSYLYGIIKLELPERFNKKFSGDFTVNIKNSDLEIDRFKYRIKDNIIEGITEFEIRTKKNKWYSVEINVDRAGLLDSFLIHYFRPHFYSLLTKDSLYYSLRSPTNEKEILINKNYRGWGAFVYSNTERVSKSIDENDIQTEKERAKKTNTKSLNYNDTSEVNSDLGDIESIENRKFYMVYPDGKSGFYRGVDDLVFIGKDTVSASRMGDDDVIVNDIEILGEEFLTTQNKISNSKGHNLSFGYGSPGERGITISGNVSNSWLSSSVENEYMDINGDSYPDYITKDSIIFSKSSGGFGSYAVSNPFDVTSSNSTAFGVSAGGTFNVAMDPNTKRVAFGPGKALASTGMNGNFSTNDNHVNDFWLDVNGDGLPDKINSNFETNFNLGYKFLNSTKVWGLAGHLQSGSGNDFAGSGSISIPKELGNLSNATNELNLSISLGFGVSFSQNHTDRTFFDLNGDGLVDYLYKEDDFLYVRFNNGSKYSNAIKWNKISNVEEGELIGGSANLGFTFTFNFLFVKVCINPSGNIGVGLDLSKGKFVDMNGDKYPDHVTYDPNSKDLKVALSTIGKTNLLSSISSPLYSTTHLDYDITPNTYDMPSSKWVLTSVKKFDGFAGDGVDTMTMRYSYEGGYYNRREREFYGFNKVISEELDGGNNNTVYRTVSQTYKNRSFVEKGLLESETLTDGNGVLFNKTLNAYDYTGAPGTNISLTEENKWVFPRLLKTTNVYYEGGNDSLINVNNFIYDPYGNITYFDDDGGNTPMNTKITYYQPKGGKYLKSIPIEVSVNNGQRLTKSVINDENGDVLKITKQMSNQTEDIRNAVYDFAYDTYGNLIKVTRPKNYKGDRLFFEYKYDPLLNTYVDHVKDAHGIETHSIYDFKYGQLLESTDPNDQKIKYILDAKGRTQSVQGPFEIESGRPYTIRYEYHPDDATPYARTSHYDSETGSDIETYTFIDGDKKIVQTKKSAVISDANGNDSDKMIVSGRQKYDAFGRVVESYYPITEPLGNEARFNTTRDPIPPTRMVYDILDRELEIKLPDNITTTMKYDIESDKFGDKLFRESTTDGNGNTKEKHLDVRDRLRSTHDIGDNEEIWTSYKYDGIDQLKEVRDALDNKIIYEYDALGRRFRTTHPDAGITKLEYDPAGNMIQKHTAVTSGWKNKSWISYHYDHERLVGIYYPLYSNNNVKYTYGDASEKSNGRAGRIKLQEDGSGGREFFYGKLGEVTKEIRSIFVAKSSLATFVTQYKYDTWNRLQEIVYPDGEVLDYAYNRAGKLIQMQGTKAGKSYEYVKNIGYDQFEQRIYLQYGNDAETRYTYTKDRRRLDNLRAASPKQSIYDLHYNYDNVNNITSLRNTNPAINNRLGGPIEQNYTYDKYYRLTGASGRAEYFNLDNKNDTLLHHADYNLAMEYDAIYNIKRKKLQVNRDDLISTKVDYTNDYEYKSGRPHTPSSVGKQRLSYDANGNMAEIYNNQISTTSFKQLTWDEDNRLTFFRNKTNNSFFTYDAKGDRVVKSMEAFAKLGANGAPIGTINHGINYTAYVNPYLVAQDSGFTKHYYIDDQRILVKEGTGKFRNIHVPGRDIGLTAGDINYYRKLQIQDSALAAFYKSLNLPPGHPSQVGLGARPDLGGQPLNDALVNLKNYTNPPRNWPSTLPTEPKDGIPGHPIWVKQEIIPDSAKGGLGFEGDTITRENEMYYYHSDHLGSANYITNDSGIIIQRADYLPFGELFIDQDKKGNIPQEYLYNGKELDDETGMYYYGARYYDPGLSLWSSVDPMVDKYPGVTPYNYVLGNPLLLKDNIGKSATIAGAVLGFVINGTANGIVNYYSTGSILEASKAALKSSISGAISGAILGATIDASSPLLVVSGASAVAGAVQSGIDQLLSGEGLNFSEIAISGITSAITGPLIQGALSLTPIKSFIKSNLFTNPLKLLKAEAWIRQSAVNKGNQYFRSVAVKEIMSGFTYSLVEAAGKSFIEEKDKKSFTPDKNFIPDKNYIPDY